MVIPWLCHSRIEEGYKPLNASFDILRTDALNAFHQESVAPFDRIFWPSIVNPSKFEERFEYKIREDYGRTLGHAPLWLSLEEPRCSSGSGEHNTPCLAPSIFGNTMSLRNAPLRRVHFRGPS